MIQDINYKYVAVFHHFFIFCARRSQIHVMQEHLHNNLHVKFLMLE